MRLRNKSLVERARETVPVFIIIGMGIAGVFVAMNVLVTAVPVVIDESTPAPSAAPSFPVLPSVPPSENPTRATYTPAPTASLPSTRPTIVHSAVSDKDANGVWVVYLSYPAFVPGTTPWAEAMNAEILSDLQDRAAQFEAGPASNRQVSGKVNTLTNTFTTDLLTPSLASFTLTIVDDTTPGHPGTTVQTFTYDLATGQQISFGDIFIDSETALAVLAVQAPPLLQAELGAAYNPTIVSDGTAGTMANYRNWALAPDGLKVTFGQSQVAATDQGLPSVVVPWTALKPVMVPTGPVAALAGFF
jgi:hypothetical protein